MTKLTVDPKEVPMSFWKRLTLALELMGESEEERIERRVRRLEAEVARLSKIQGTRGGTEDDSIQAEPSTVRTSVERKVRPA